MPPPGPGTPGPLRSSAFGTLLAGYTVSAVGDGMAVVAVAWLAITLAGGHGTGLLVGAAVAAYTLPGVVAWLFLGRFFAGWDGRKLVLAEGALRAVALAAVAVLAALGDLTPVTYVVLLGASSLFGLLGVSGDLAAVVELLPTSQQLAGNSMITVASFGASILGPVLAGGVIAVASAGTAIAVDAASFLVLVAAAALSRRFQPPPPQPTSDRQGAAAALRALTRQPSVLGITVVCVVFFAIYGPVEVALPVYVDMDLRAGGGVLGGFWAVFSVGAAVGALAVTRLERYGRWRVVVLSVLGWGVCLVPLGLVASLTVGFTALAVGGMCYGPFLPLKTAIIQRDSPPGSLTAIAAASALFTVPAAPLGTALGGPIVGALGAPTTLIGSGVATIVLAASCIALLHRTRPREAM